MTTTTNVLKLATTKTTKPAPKQHTRGFVRRMRRQSYTAIGAAGVAFLLTALSLKHLSAGIQIVTECDCWEAWAMAGVIDLGFIAIELAMVMASTPALTKEIKRWGNPAVRGMLTGSAIMNAFAFARPAVVAALAADHFQIGQLMIIPAVVLGLAIPAFLYAVTRIGAALYIDCDTRGR
jgi:hypothetical protein